MPIILMTLMLVSALGQMSSDLYLPSLPAIAQTLVVSVNDAQFTITAYMLGLSCSQLVYGPLSDAVGRRKPVIFGLILCVLGSLVCLITPNWSILMLGRILQGIGAGAGTSLARSIMRDLFDKEELAKNNSYIAMSAVILLTIAPIIGGWVEVGLGWRYNFVILFGLSTIALILFLLYISESNQHISKDNFNFKTFKLNVGRILSSKHFLRYALCPLFTYGGILAWLTVTPVLLQQQLMVSPTEMGWLYLCSGLGFSFGVVINIKWVQHYGIDSMMKVGFLCQLSSGCLMLIFYLLELINLATIAVPICFFMMGSSLVFPNSSAGAFTPFAKIAGTAAAIFGFMQVLGGVISSGLLALSHDNHVLPMASALIIAALGGMMVFRIFR